MAHYRKKSRRNQFGIMSGSGELHKLIRDNLGLYTLTMDDILLAKICSAISVFIELRSEGG